MKTKRLEIIVNKAEKIQSQLCYELDKIKAEIERISNLEVTPHILAGDGIAINVTSLQTDNSIPIGKFIELIKSNQLDNDTLKYESLL